MDVRRECRAVPARTSGWLAAVTARSAGVVTGSLIAAGALGAQTSSTRPAAPRTVPGDSSAVAAVVTGFHHALSAGDTATAMRLLAADVVILESGDTENRAQYAASHLAADVEFARATRASGGPVRVAVQGDAAWASSTSRTRGAFHGRAVDADGAELMVLTRTAEGWRIRAVHWSSHAHRPPR